jgi:hypothetical protein
VELAHPAIVQSAHYAMGGSDLLLITMSMSAWTLSKNGQSAVTDDVIDFVYEIYLP